MTDTHTNRFLSKSYSFVKGGIKCGYSIQSNSNIDLRTVDSGTFIWDKPHHDNILKELVKTFDGILFNGILNDVMKYCSIEI